jgi:hypothetical protein
VEVLHCQRCNAPHEAGDNFCRRCGNRVVALPAVRPATAVTRRPPNLAPSLVGSVAVLALGTGLEWVARRLMAGATRSAGRALVSSEKPPRNAVQPMTRQELPTTTIDEIVYVRKVQLRR